MKKVVCLSVCLFAGAANAGVITTFSDRTAFDAAVGTTTLEDFTSTKVPQQFTVNLKALL